MDQKVKEFVKMMSQNLNIDNISNVNIHEKMESLTKEDPIITWEQ